MSSAPTSHATGTPTSRALSSSTMWPTPTYIARIPIETTAAITVTILRITMGPPITGGPTIRGQRRFTTVGAGVEPPGTDTTVDISPLIQPIPRLPSG